MTPSRAVPILLAVALAGSCSGDAPAPTADAGTAAPGTAPQSTGQRTGQRSTGAHGQLRLAPFADCAAFLDHVRNEALERVGPYGFDGREGGGWPWPPGVPMAAADGVPGTEAPAATIAASEMDGDAASDGGFTGTNVQEAGIDEADLVKTDGERIAVIANGRFHLVDPTLPDARVTGSLDLNDDLAMSDLFLAGDRAVLFGMRWDEADGRASTVVTEVTLADPAAPEVVAELTVAGSYLSSRLIGTRLRLAVSSAPEQIPFVVPGGPAGEELAEQTNRQAILDSQLADWTPEYQLEVIGGEPASGPLVDCASLHQPAAFSGFDVLSVLDVDLSGPDSALAAAFGRGGPGAGVAVLGSGSTVYSSANRMYLATTRWAGETGGQGDEPWAPATALHSFAIDPAGPTRYVASGEVEGTLLSQFSLDEHDGNLRVIVTTADQSGQSESRLTVLAEQADELVEIGSVGGLGHGEQLYSARLLDDLGFAVTFRQVDPFYVLDLADPTNPQMVGELKIPGMSTYLHPFGDVAETGLVLGLGQDGTDGGQLTGVKLSVFDVADPANPTEVAKWTLPGGSSIAEYDHRAFQIVGDIVIVPIQYPTPGAQVLRVSADGITELGFVEHLRGPDTPAGSDCRQLDADDLAQENSSFFWDVRNGAVVQVCGPNDAGGWAGTDMSCWSVGTADLPGMFWETGAYDVFVEQVGLGDDDRLEVCYPGGPMQPVIERSFVIGDVLWTFSTDRLQANSLADLTVVAEVPLQASPNGQ